MFIKLFRIQVGKNKKRDSKRILFGSLIFLLNYQLSIHNCKKTLLVRGGLVY